MTTISRREFREQFSQGVDLKNQDMRAKLREHGVDDKELDGLDKDKSGRLEGKEELDGLFDVFDRHDDDASSFSLNGAGKAGKLVDALKTKPSSTSTTPAQPQQPVEPPVPQETSLEAAKKALYDAEQNDGALSGNELQGARDKIASKYGDKEADKVMKESLGLKLDKLDESGADWVKRMQGSMDGNIDRYQQALGTHLKDAKLIDANFDGKLDANDIAWTKGADGKVTTQKLGQALTDRVKIGGAMIGAAEDMDKAKHEFALIKDHKFNDKFWQKDSADGTFKLKPGVKPSEALKDVFKSPDKYKFECATALVLTQYKAMHDLVGSKDFDRIAKDLRVGPWETESAYKAHHALTGSGSTEATPERRDTLRAGDYGYFKNWDVSDDGRKAGWQGENVIYLGNGKFYGHPFGIASEKTIVDHLNTQRNSGSTRPASFLDLRSTLQPSILAEDKVPG